MSVTPDLIKSKLSSLDQTSDTIVSVSSWLLFHRRSAAVIVDTWLQAVRDGSSNRKLSLIYLANEVSQQSRAKKRPEYPAEFGRVMPEAIENVFRHATTDVQGKITRVVDVWRQRSVYTDTVLAEINARISGKDKPANRPTSSGLSAAVPNEIAALSEHYTKLFGATSSASLAVGTANSLYSNLFDEKNATPSPDLYAAKLRQLDAALRLSEQTVNAALLVRKDLGKQLQMLLDRNAAAIAKDEETSKDTADKLSTTDMAIRHNTQVLEEQAAHPERSTTPDMAPPTPEALTPPAADSSMPDGEAQTTEQDGNGANGTEVDLDPVAKLQMELDPSIAALLARHAESNLVDAGEESDPYIP